MFRVRGHRLLVLSVILFAILAPAHLRQIRSANLTAVSATLSNPRLSYSAILDAGNVTGSNLVTINTTDGAAPSTSSANLFEGEAVTIGAGSYTVASVSAEGSFTVTPGLGASDDDAGDAVIALRRPAITLGFTTVTSMEEDWDFRVLVPAGTTDPDDSIPDDDGWDYGSTTPTDVDVTCPAGNTYTASQGIASVTIGGVTYHSFVCNLDDATVVAAGSTLSMVVGDTADPLDSLINPAPNATHINGYGDSYPIIVQQLDAAGNVIDQTTAAVSVVDAVRITASVPPQISFRILGVASGQSRCGNTTSVPTSSTLVPLGELLIDAFKNAAQELVVSTNASGGYAVTGVSANQLHRVGEACTGDADETDGGCIVDTTGNNADINHTTTGLWTSTDAKGFGYSLQENVLSADASAVFEHTTSGGTCTGASGDCWKQFADAEDSQAPQTLFSSTSVADNDSVYVCYKAVVSPTQQAGTDYSTYVTYRATATF